MYIYIYIYIYIYSFYKFSRLAGQKTANFADFIFAIKLFIVNFVEFIFVMDRFER